MLITTKAYPLRSGIARFIVNGKMPFLFFASLWLYTNSANSQENLTPEDGGENNSSVQAIAPSRALLFVENPDKFPANDHIVFSKIQTPWHRAKTEPFNGNHDSVKISIRNNGIDPLIISNLTISNTASWKIEKLNTTPYIQGKGLPKTVATGGFLDVTLRFIAKNQSTRVNVLNETLKITSNDSKTPLKTVYLHGLWQIAGEGKNEPYAQEIIATFGFKSNTGFGQSDPNLGDSTKLKGDEIKPSFFVRADASFPVTATQMAAYHGCCYASEKIQWFVKGTTTLKTIYAHMLQDAQTLLPRQTNGTVASGTFNPATPFGFNVGVGNLTDASKNPGKKIGVRVWKAIDVSGNVIPNSYIIGNDYLGTPSTNYDYNDNLHFISNVKPYNGTAFYSALNASRSALDFGERILQTTGSINLDVKSLGKLYSNGSRDPVITISSVKITGENYGEFSANPPVDATLNPQQTTSITVKFKPVSQGLKIADLLIYYNNALSPLRVPLYGIAKASGTTVKVHYRIKGGRTTPITVNGKTWSGDAAYAHDNLQPATNPGLSNIAGTDDDVLYLTKQSSNGDKKPFRYEIANITNGNYVVRLHFAEIYWGAPGLGAAGGAGSRVFNVKLENQYRVINLDLAQEAGAAVALIRNFPVTVSDGKLNIDFSANINRPMVSAVEVYSFSSASSPTNVTTLKNRPALLPVAETNLLGGFDKPRIFPNPLLSPELNIQFPVKYKGIYYIELIDMPGRKYILGKTRLSGTGSLLKINVSRFSLKPGVYFLKINADVGKTDVLKLLVK